MFTTYSLIMAQVEFGIISIVGKNVVESELKLQIFCSIFDDKLRMYCLSLLYCQKLSVTGFLVSR